MTPRHRLLYELDSYSVLTDTFTQRLVTRQEAALGRIEAAYREALVAGQLTADEAADIADFLDLLAA